MNTSGAIGSYYKHDDKASVLLKDRESTDEKLEYELLKKKNVTRNLSVGRKGLQPASEVT